MSIAPEYTIQNFKVFVPVVGGVIIFDIRSPRVRRFIANSSYDAEYPTLHTVQEIIDATKQIDEFYNECRRRYSTTLEKLA